MHFREASFIVLTFFTVIFFSPSINGLPVQRYGLSSRHLDPATNSTPSVKKLVIISGLFIFFLALAGVLTLRVLSNDTDASSGQTLFLAPSFNPRRLWGGVCELFARVPEAQQVADVTLEDVAPQAIPAVQRPSRATTRGKITRPVAGIRPA
ncbi:hypothetical protein CPB83DRAFT_898803 [Crepidotus variabilis]|uniref:Uncharacterized protein n=1 Tax=Crepidotus variabilis TaxID=179855 RepID=A0A9P6E6H3_9AGAR|nr:hypothetical protein CPB83DRAFT_898803 [Crepidotus variabilis]